MYLSLSYMKRQRTQIRSCFTSFLASYQTRRNGRNQIVLELRGYAVEGDASIDSGCRVRNGKAQLPNHVNPPSVTVLGSVERVVARNSLLSHHITSATTAKRIEHIEHQH